MVYEHLFIIMASFMNLEDIEAISRQGRCLGGEQEGVPRISLNLYISLNRIDVDSSSI